MRTTRGPSKSVSGGERRPHRLLSAGRDGGVLRRAATERAQETPQARVTTQEGVRHARRGRERPDAGVRGVRAFRRAAPTTVARGGKTRALRGLAARIGLPSRTGQG